MFYDENGVCLLDYWLYNNIRECNVFIENIVKLVFFGVDYIV